MKQANSKIFVDLETTGLNPSVDKICQIGIILPDGQEINQLVNPGIAIPSSSTEIHGITNEMVIDAPYFDEVADIIISGLNEAEIFVAYNFVFDFQFLQNELFNCCGFVLAEKDFQFLDPYKIFRKMFPHSLSNAYKFYTGREMVGAHCAIDDIRATKEVLDQQVTQYPELFTKSVKEIQDFTIGDVSILGKWFETNEHGLIKFKQGKFKGEIVKFNIHRDYLKWISNLEDLSFSEKRYLEEIL